MPLQIKSLAITINGTTYHADVVHVTTAAERHQRLIVSLTRYLAADTTPLISDEMMLARISVLKAAFAQTFPAAPALRESGMRSFADFHEWVYWFSGITEEHIEWARAAKESGLIQSYSVDYDPQAQGGDA